jgi:hypothetical protein
LSTAVTSSFMRVYWSPLLPTFISLLLHEDFLHSPSKQASDTQILYLGVFWGGSGLKHYPLIFLALYLKFHLLSECQSTNEHTLGGTESQVEKNPWVWETKRGRNWFCSTLLPESVLGETVLLTLTTLVCLSAGLNPR